MSRPTRLKIDLAALQNNLQRVRDIAPNSKVLAMVKANAYGHGVIPVAKALKGADALSVASIEEGLTLREAGITQPIVLIEGLFTSDEVDLAARYDFTLVVHHAQQIEMLEQAGVNKTFSVWLKLNTGMHRLGINVNDLSSFYHRLQILPNVQQPIGLMTHFAEADVIQSRATTEQMELFDATIHHLPGARSLANSAGILAWPAAHHDWVRPGLMLYGASPFPDKTGLDHGLLPVMTLSSRLIAINDVKKGGKVGYGGTWTAPEDIRIGVVGVGYGDGYPQSAKNGTPVLVNGSECELVGRVSMDMLTVDLRLQPNAKVGDEVVLWGEGLPVERVARHSHSSAYELFTRMTSRPKLEVLM
jgi:alanine racemase